MKVRIPEGTSLIEAVGKRLLRSDLPLEGHVIVFPGRRPAHFLRRFLAERKNSAFRPPSIFSMDDFIDWLYERALEIRDTRLTPPDAIAILHELYREMRDRGRDPFERLDNFLSLGYKLFSDFEELMIEKVSPERLKEAGNLFPDCSAKIPEFFGMLHEYYRTFYETLRQEGLSTRATRYRRVSEELPSLEPGLKQHLLFAGFYALTASERDIFSHFKEDAIFIFQSGPGLDERLKELGMDAELSEDPPATPVPLTEKVKLYQAPDLHGEIFGLNTLLSESPPERDDPTDTAIVLPSSESLFPLYNQALQGLEGPFNISMGYPIVRTPLYGFFSCLMETVLSAPDSGRREERLYIPSYLKFILHPYTKNIVMDEDNSALASREDLAGISRMIFHGIESLLSHERTNPFISLKEIEEKDSFLQETARLINRSGQTEKELSAEEISRFIKEIHSATIRRFSAFENIGDLAQAAMEIIYFIYGRSTAPAHPYFYPFAETFLKALDDMKSSRLGTFDFERTSSYFTFFRRYLTLYRTPFEGTPLSGLQVMGLLETRNLRFRRLIILDMNEDLVPGTTREEAIIPFTARKFLGLPTYQDREALIGYYLETLMRGAGEVHLFFQESSRKERSRYIERILWELQKRDGTVEYRSYIIPLQYSLNLINRPPDEIPKTGEIVETLKLLTFSPTTLDRYLKCPLRFFYSDILHLREKTAPSSEIERKDLGSLVHRIIGRAIRKVPGGLFQPGKPGEEIIEGVIRDEFRKVYGYPPEGRAYLLYRQLKGKVLQFFEEYLPGFVSGRRVVLKGVEEELKGTFEGFSVYGRIDLHLEKDGRPVIIDLKTSSTDNHLRIRLRDLSISEPETWAECIGSLQIPLYMFLYSMKYGMQEEMDAFYLLLGRRSLTSDEEVRPFRDADPGSGLETIRALLKSLFEEITDPSTPFRPPQNLKNACPDCTYQYICGTQWIN